MHIDSFLKMAAAAGLHISNEKENEISATVEDSMELDDGEDIMESILKGAEAISLTLLPAKSAAKYLHEYELFSTWRTNKKIPENNATESVMLVYFDELKSKKHLLISVILWS